MKDYIEREEVKKEIIEWASRLANPKYLDRDATLDIIRLIPSADVAEVRHGKWEVDEVRSKEHIENIYVCSACKNFEAWGETEITNYCPYCGARMEEVRKK